MRPALFVLCASLLACADKPPLAPDNNNSNNGGSDPNAVVIPIQPASSANANANANAPTNPDDPLTDEDRAKLRDKIERVAEERARLEGLARGETAVEAADGKDPLHGRFTLADATATLSPQAGALVATIKTNMGQMKCRLFDDRAPITVANFVGLARGLRPYKSPADGRWVKQPIYDGTTFHRIIKGFMIQGGDPKGNGTGEPGYVIPDEVWVGAKHDHAGQLCMANRGPNTNGAQFFITDASVPHLDSGYTIFGECSPVSVVHAIANVPIGPSDRPRTPVTIDKVEITRDPSAPGGARPPPPPPKRPVKSGEPGF